MRLSHGLLSMIALAICQALALGQSTDSPSTDVAAPKRLAMVDSADQLYRRAESLYRDRNWRSAAKTLRDFVHQYPNSPRAVWARFYLGEAHVQNGQLAMARASYRAFLDSIYGDDQRSPSAGHRNHLGKALFRIGESSFLLGETHQAELELREFCRVCPNHADMVYALPLLADLAFERNDFEDSIRLADRQIRLKGPKPAETQLIIARSYQAMNQFEAAREACKMVAAESSARFEVLAKSKLVVAESFAQESRWQKAIRAYQQLAALRPIGATMDPSVDTAQSQYRARALEGAADCYLRSGHSRLAKQTLSRLLVEFPDSEFSRRATNRLATDFQAST